MEEIKILEIDDTSFECQSLIQFSSLIKLLYKLNQKEKSLEQKVNTINQVLIEKEKRIKNLELKFERQSKFDELKKPQSFISSPIKQENYESSSKYINKQSKDIEEKKETDKKEEKNLDDKKEKEINNELYEIKNEDKEKSEEINNEIKDEKVEDMIKDDNKEKSEEKDIDKKKEDNIDNDNKIEKIDLNIKNFEIKKDDMKSSSEIKNEEIKSFGEFKSEEMKSSGDLDSPRNISPDLIKNLVKRSKDYEKRIMDLTKKSNEHLEFVQNHKKNNELINKNSYKILDLQNSINDLLTKFSEQKTELEDLKVKIQDFNIFDILKSSNSGGNLDLSKALIMNLENKVFKKFGYYDERYKSYDTDIFKIKEDNKNLNNTFNTMKIQQEKNKEEIQSNLDELNKNLTENINELNNQLIELKTELDNKKNNNEENDENINNIINTKIQQSEENMKSYLKKEMEENNKNINDNINKEIKGTNKLHTVDNENIKNISKKLTDLEKIVFTKEKGIQKLKDKIQTMEDDNFKKFSKLELLLNLKDKIDLLEEEMNTESLKFNNIQQSYDKTRSDISNLVHKIEYVNSELTKLTMQKLSTSNEKPEINIDFSKYLEKNDFINNKNEINNKFEKVRLAIENLGRNIESILASLGHVVNDKEMSTFQTTVKNNFDELKQNFMKKFADKIETNKNLKILDTQVKNLIENNNKKDMADNWLLAKKPLNNYLCASCESVIRGELDKRSDYIAWNKYPSRDDKTYRMGHGFSKMLKMVDDGIMRSTNVDNNIYQITENNNQNLRTIFNVNNSSRLPKMRKKFMNTEQNVNNEDPLSFRDKNKEEQLTIDEQNNLKQPQIMKIYKINKNYNEKLNITPHKSSNSNSVNNIHKNIIIRNDKKVGTDINNSNNLKTYS